jgi:hypothetical protein
LLRQQLIGEFAPTRPTSRRLFMSRQKLKRPNAHKHGVFSATAILPGEDKREFEKLHAAVIKEWRPVGATEQDAVLSIAKAVWRKRRVQKFLEVQLKRNTVDPAHPSYNVKNAVSALLVNLHHSPDTAYDDYAHQYLHPEKIKYLNEKYPSERFSSTSERAVAIANELRSLLEVPTYFAPAFQQIDQLFHTATNFSDDMFKQELALDERLDAMIDRAVKRLIQTKAMKQMLGSVARNPSAGQQQGVVSNTIRK